MTTGINTDQEFKLSREEQGRIIDKLARENGYDGVLVHHVVSAMTADLPHGEIAEKEFLISTALIWMKELLKGLPPSQGEWESGEAEEKTRERSRERRSLLTCLQVFLIGVRESKDLCPGFGFLSLYARTFKLPEPGEFSHEDTMRFLNGVIAGFLRMETDISPI